MFLGSKENQGRVLGGESIWIGPWETDRFWQVEIEGKWIPMFKAMEVRKLRADKKSFAVIEPLCSQDGMEGGTVDEEDQA